MSKTLSIDAAKLAKACERAIPGDIGKLVAGRVNAIIEEYHSVADADVEVASATPRAKTPAGGDK